MSPFMRQNLSIGLQVKQSLALSPQLLQSMTVLQLGHQELLDYLQEQSLENPFIELESVHEVQRTPPSPNREPTLRRSKNHDLSQKKHEALQNVAAHPPDFLSQLREQIALQDVSKKQKALLEILLQHLDHRGYLTLHSIAADMNDDDFSEEEFQLAVKTLQSFDPPGLGARDLKECLLLQLGPKEQFQLERRIIEDHLELIIHNRIPTLMKALNQPKERVLEAVQWIRSLHPQPARSLFNKGGRLAPLHPDLTIAKQNDEWHIFWNKRPPKIRWSPETILLFKENKEARSNPYFKNHYQSTQGLLRSIEQRRCTVEAVLREIIRFQEDFLLEGPRSLKPMTMQDIAEPIGIHGSTVSRAIKGKVLQCPSGIYQIRQLFSPAFESKEGPSLSSYTVLDQLRRLIAQEDKEHPLTDERLAKELKQSLGIAIKRRTVANYRCQLEIPTARLRRRLSFPKSLSASKGQR